MTVTLKRAIAVLLGLCTFLGAVTGIIQVFWPGHQRLILMACLVEILVVLAAILIYRRFQILSAKRTAEVRVIHGYSETLKYLEEIVRKARKTIWTVRTHVGEASVEEPFFQVVAERALRKRPPLEDFRRNIHMVNSEATRHHMYSLIDEFANVAGVKVSYFHGIGPRLDFIIVDGCRAVIGLPMSEAHGVSASIAIEDSKCVKGVEDAFRDLWNHSDALFVGSQFINDEKKQQLRIVVDAEVQKAFVPVGHGLHESQALKASTPPS